MTEALDLSAVIADLEKRAAFWWDQAELCKRVRAAGLQAVCEEAAIACMTKAVLLREGATL